MIRPGSTIGILGGGQLGRMMALSARSLGYRVHVLDPDSGCSASPVADRVFAARFDDASAAAELASTCQVVTVEIERIARESLDRASRHCPTRPGADVLARAQDRRTEKTWLNENGFPTAPFRIVQTEAEIAEAVRELGSSVAKTAREGYDGKGQQRIRSAAEVRPAFEALGGRPLVVEQWMPLEIELSVIVARRPSGEVRTFPAALNHHEHHILDWSVMPGLIDEATVRKAEETARAIATRMKLEGLLAIEFFKLPDGRLLVNEMAPRPHNSGHPATEACLTSQFEQAVRSICDLPLGSTEVVRPTAITNLLGDLWANGDPAFDRALEIEGVTLHLYGKESARPGRKMGHLSASGHTIEEAIEKAKEARRRLTAVTQ